MARDTASSPLPEPLDLDMVKQSQRLLSKVGVSVTRLCTLLLTHCRPQLE